jgi:hypothetical protein
MHAWFVSVGKHAGFSWAVLVLLLNDTPSIHLSLSF